MRQDDTVKQKITVSLNPATWLKLLILALFWMALPIAAQAQSTLAFPRFLSPGDLPGTGFAIVNYNATPATVTFTYYGLNGSALSTATLTIPAGGQIAKLGSELFPSVGASGWVRATSPTPY